MIRVLAAVLLTLGICSFGVGVGGALAAVAASDPGGVIAFITSATVLSLVGIGTGIAIKYFPPLAKIPNLIIPYLNALIVFLGAFAGAEPAQAGILSGVFHHIPFGIKVILSGAISGAGSLAYEVYLRHAFEKLGFVKAT